MGALDFLLTSHRDMQVLYISAHGIEGQLCFDADGQERFGFQELGTSIATGLHGMSARPVVVLGACFAMAKEVEVQRNMPPEVLELIGFTSTPTSGNVAALIAAVLRSDEELLQKVTGNVAAAANAGNSVEAAAEVAFDAHDSRLYRFLKDRTGLAIRHLSQDDNGMWTGRTIQIP